MHDRHPGAPLGAALAGAGSVKRCGLLSMGGRHLMLVIAVADATKPGSAPLGSLRWLYVGSFTIGLRLLIRDGATFVELRLTCTEIGGQVAMDGSTFNSRLYMDSVTIGANLLMRHAVFYKEVKLIYSGVGTNLEARAAELGGLDLKGTRVARELWLGSPDFNAKGKEYRDKNNGTHFPKLRLLTPLSVRFKILKTALSR